MPEAAAPPGGGWAHPRDRGCGPLRPPLRLMLWIRESSGEIGFLAYFPGFFMIVDFLHKN